jgi:hypothetical protein
MSQADSTTVRLKVSPEIARIVKPGAPRDVQMAAARGALPLAGKDLLTVLFFLCSSQDVELKRAAVTTLRELPENILVENLRNESVHPQLLNLLVWARSSDAELMGAVIMHPAATEKTLVALAGRASADVLERLAGQQNLLSRYPLLVEAIIANPRAEKKLKYRLGWQDPVQAGPVNAAQSPARDDGADVAVDEGRSQTEIEALMEEADQHGLSKYQIALELKVAEKIKMGLTGDKEWRSILIKESNKLVQGAVMKNPRITDGEVLMVAKNKTSSDEMVRIILLNKDWMKNYDIKKALVTHPKTPIPKALRFINTLTTKDIKDLARSRQVSNIVATAARKELELRLKKMGG